MNVLNMNISYLIDKNRLNQQEFANLIEVSNNVVSTWVKSRGNPKYDKLLLISEKFNVSCDDLLKTDLSKQKSDIGLLGVKNNTITMYGVAENDLHYDNQFKQNLKHLLTNDLDIKKAILQVLQDALLK